MAATVLWNGLIGVDTFFVIGGCLLAFHTMKELDKTNGGNKVMWFMFYVHRYIRLTGVYAIIIALHATLLKFAAGGPQSHLVSALVSKCQKGWWLNLLYINNFAADIYGPGEADCINVSWYMAIDMQFFLVTPLFLSLVWRRPRLGYLVAGLLLAAGTASQLTFTVVDDEYFHGGFSYYVKPWNRSQPYIIGLLLGVLLHKVRHPDLSPSLSIKFQLRDSAKLSVSPLVTSCCWSLAAVLAVSVVYGVYGYSLLLDARVAQPFSGQNPPLAARVIFNGFGKIAWALAISWLILACVKNRGGPVNTILSWPVWIPLARVQYCVYLLHR